MYYLNVSIYTLRNLVFQIVWKSHLWSLHLKMLGRRLRLKHTALSDFFLWSVKSWKKLNIKACWSPREMLACFLIFRMASSISVQLQIFKQLYLIDMLRAFNRSGASEAISFDTQSFWQSLAHWSFSQTQVLWSFRLGIWLYFVISWKLTTLSSSVEKILQKHPVNAGAQQGSRLGPMLPLL